MTIVNQSVVIPINCSN